MTTECKDDDIFDEQAKETDIESKHWETLMSYRMKDGLRDGMSEGHDSCLQDSFNQGFHDGFRSVYNVSILRGISRTFCLKGVETDVASEIYNKLRSLENSVLEALKERAQAPRDKSSETDVFESTSAGTAESTVSDPNSPCKLNDSKKLEIEGSFVELKEECLKIVRNLNDTSLALTLNAMINNISF